MSKLFDHREAKKNQGRNCLIVPIPPAESLWLDDDVRYVGAVLTAPKCSEIMFFGREQLQSPARRSHHGRTFP
jgi:hypothetical protein